MTQPTVCCSKHYDELEEEPDEDMRRRTMHLSSDDITPERAGSNEKQPGRGAGQVGFQPIRKHWNPC